MPSYGRVGVVCARTKVAPVLCGWLPQPSGVNRSLIALAAPVQHAALIAAIFIINFLDAPLARPRHQSGHQLADPDELVFQSVPGSVRGSPNRGITLASKPVTALMRSPAIVTTCSP